MKKKSLTWKVPPSVINDRMRKAMTTLARKQDKQARKKKRG